MPLPSEAHYTDETVHLVARALVATHEGPWAANPDDHAHLWYDEARAALDVLAAADLLKPPIIPDPPDGAAPVVEGTESWPAVARPPSYRRLRVVR